MAYRAFGEELENTGTGTAPKYSYTGKELDSSGLYYYDPELSRFITPDTIYDAGPQGLNRYSYALNNPILYRDPTGHFIKEDDEQNPTGDGCVTGSPENGGDTMVYHKNFDDSSHLDVGYMPRWPHRIASMSDDVIIPTACRGDELWADQRSPIGPWLEENAGNLVGAIRPGEKINPFTGKPVPYSVKEDVMVDIVAAVAFSGVFKSRDGTMTFYHGTSESGAASIRKNGIDLTHSRKKSDFGKGFYVTTDKQQALNWVKFHHSGKGEVLEFKMLTRDFNGLKGLDFTHKSHPSLAGFFRHNRLAGPLHSYDYITGPLLKNSSKFLQGRPAILFGQQTSFHSQHALGLLYRGLQ